jgi:hypothetical protein
LSYCANPQAGQRARARPLLDGVSGVAQSGQ